MPRYYGKVISFDDLRQQIEIRSLSHYGVQVGHLGQTGGIKRITLADREEAVDLTLQAFVARLVGDDVAEEAAQDSGSRVRARNDGEHAVRKHLSICGLLFFQMVFVNLEGRDIVNGG